MQTTSPPTKLLLLLALLGGLALRVPGWFTQDAKRPYRTFEIDESQHVDIAVHQIRQLAPDSLPDWKIQQLFNVRGYGNQLGAIALGWWKVSGQKPGSSGLILLGRQLSTLFFVLLLLVVYQLGLRLDLSPYGAALGAVLLAACDLNASYSHYAIPAIGYVCWSWLSLLGAVWAYTSGRWWPAILAGLGAAGALAFKLDFLPGTVALLATLAYGLRTSHWRTTTKQLLTLVIAAYAGYQVLSVGNFDWPAMQAVFTALRGQNASAVAVDAHWLHNPLIYVIGLVAAIGLPVAFFAVYRLRIGRRWWASGWWIVLLLAALEFGVRWSIDTPFVRRLNIFMPLLCLAAARGLGTLAAPARRRWVPLVVGYTVALALVGQANHWFDTRARARDWLQDLELAPEERIAYTPYAYAAKMPDGGSHRAEWTYLVAHETFYSRYGLSFTTPFGFPDCCAEVYHCGGEAECAFFQGLLTQPAAVGVEPVASFRTFDIFPERLLYHALFGYFETFLGDTRIYRRTD